MSSSFGSLNLSCAERFSRSLSVLALSSPDGDGGLASWLDPASVPHLAAALLERGTDLVELVMVHHQRPVS